MVMIVVMSMLLQILLRLCWVWASKQQTTQVYRHIEMEEEYLQSWQWQDTVEGVF